MADRHNFTKETSRKLCDRVASQCSNPDCRAPTKGPHSDGDVAMSVGTAAHIHAAAPGGPRYDATQTEEERRSINNGLWLCRNCGTMIDVDEERYPAPLLRKWKMDAELDAFNRLGKPSAAATAPSDGLPFSDGAAEVMTWLAEKYVAAGYPQFNLWTFTPLDQNDPVLGELRALGLLYFGGPRGGPWRLTEAGLRWVMQNRRR
jgi:hypothetical protein